MQGPVVVVETATRNPTSTAVQAPSSLRGKLKQNSLKTMHSIRHISGMHSEPHHDIFGHLPELNNYDKKIFLALIPVICILFISILVLITGIIAYTGPGGARNVAEVPCFKKNTTCDNCGYTKELSTDPKNYVKLGSLYLIVVYPVTILSMISFTLCCSKEVAMMVCACVIALISVINFWFCVDYVFIADLCDDFKVAAAPLINWTFGMAIFTIVWSIPICCVLLVSLTYACAD